MQFYIHDKKFDWKINFKSSTENDGLCYCMYYNPGIIPNSINSIIMANNVNTIQNATTIITLNGILSAKYYDIYCATISSQGAIMSYNNMLASKKSVFTPGKRLININMFFYYLQ